MPRKGESGPARTHVLHFLFRFSRLPATVANGPGPRAYSLILRGYYLLGGTLERDQPGRPPASSFRIHKAGCSDTRPCVFNRLAFSNGGQKPDGGEERPQVRPLWAKAQAGGARACVGKVTEGEPGVRLKSIRATWNLSYSRRSSGVSVHGGNSPS